MATPKAIRALFYADLPNDGAARKFAQRIANRLAKTSKADRWEAIVVTDDGNEICEVPVPYRH